MSKSKPTTKNTKRWKSPPDESVLLQQERAEKENTQPKHGAELVPRGKAQVPRGLANIVPPRKLHLLIAIRALQLLNQHRVLRALDISAACFPERPYTAAQQATGRCLRGLKKNGFIEMFVSEKKHTMYAITKAGARYLAENSFDSDLTHRPTSSSARVAAMINPEHLNWTNFVALACRPRGLIAYTEAEFMKPMGIGTKTRPGLLYIEKNGRKTWFRPDVIALEASSLVWFEIDASRRGAARAAKFEQMTHQIGVLIDGLASLPNARVQRASIDIIVTLTTQKSYFARIKRQLKQEIETCKDMILTEGSGNRRIVDVGNGIYEVWKARYVNDQVSQKDVCVGHIILQMLPKGLANYRNNGTPAEWFDENTLPYRRPARMPDWPISHLESPFIDMADQRSLYD